jgi:signal transduction histidine kinase
MTDSSMTPAANEILATLPETIVQIDHDWAIEHVNRPESPVFVRRANRGDRLDEVLAPEASEAVIGLIDNAQVTGGALAEYHSGSDLYRVTARPLSSAPLTLLVFKNITGIRGAGQAIVDLVRERSTFLAAVSNELHSPLAAVVGYANLLSNTEVALDDETRSAMVRHMTDQAWDLAGIVEDLLTVAHAELGELHLVKVQVNVGANVAQVLESMGTRGSSVIVIESEAVFATGDPARFRQVIRNLLSNALRHGREPVTVEISRDVGEALVLVKDAGDGVGEELAQLIADQNTSGYSASPGSLGLGLWICHELTRLMGGGLAYDRVDGETVFKAAIPMI